MIFLNLLSLSIGAVLYFGASGCAVVIVEESRREVLEAQISDELWPTIDCQGLFTGPGHPDYSKIVTAIGKALTTRGFFFAPNAVDSQLISDAYAAAKQAHDLPSSTKMAFAGKGYTGPDVDIAELAYEPQTTSIVRAWDYAKADNTFVATDAAYPPYLDIIASRLYDEQAKFARVFLQALSEALDVPAEQNLAQHSTTGELGTLRFLKYPLVEQSVLQDALTVGISAHTDFEVFTLMHQDAPGLQVRARNSKVWETVPYDVGDADNPTVGSFLIIVGDVLERMTNGYLQATPHRVLPSTTTERHSIIRFNAFAPETVVAPLPQFVDETMNPPKYGNTTMEEIMRVITGNLREGLGAWDIENDRSATANYDYSPYAADQVCQAPDSTCTN